MRATLLLLIVFFAVASRLGAIPCNKNHPSPENASIVLLGAAVGLAGFERLWAKLRK